MRILIKTKVKEACRENGVVFSHLVKALELSDWQFKQTTYAKFAAGKLTPVLDLTDKQIEVLEHYLGDTDNLFFKL